MKQKSVLTIISIAIIAGLAIYLGNVYLKPAKERAEAKEPVLSGAYDARVEECRILEDHELPEGVEAPEIGSAERYVRLVVLFPEVITIKGAGHEYQLDRINGTEGASIGPVHADIEVAEDGVVLTLTYKTDDDFEHGRVVRNGDVIVEKATLE